MAAGAAFFIWRNAMWKRVGDVLVELCEEKGPDYFDPDPLIGYSLAVNNFEVMFFPAKDHAIAQKAYERLIYALS
jgi:hypothetical protein